MVEESTESYFLQDELGDSDGHSACYFCAEFRRASACACVHDLKIIFIRFCLISLCGV